MAHRVIHPESTFKMFIIFGIFRYHIATSKLDTIKSKVTGDYMILKNTNKNKNYVEIFSKFSICLIKFLNSDIDLLDLNKLGNLFQIKDPRKCIQLVFASICGWNEKYWTPSQVNGTSLYLKYDHINWAFKVPVLLYVSKCCW